MSHDLCVSRCMPFVCLAQPIIPLIHLILDSQTRALNGRWILGQIRTLHLDAILSTFSREECIMLQQERTQNERRGVPPGLPWLFFQIEITHVCSLYPDFMTCVGWVSLGVVHWPYMVKKALLDVLHSSIFRWTLRPWRHLHTNAAHPDRRELVRLLLQEPTVAQRGEWGDIMT